MTGRLHVPIASYLAIVPSRSAVIPECSHGKERGNVTSSLSVELIAKVAPSVQGKGMRKKIKLTFGPGIEVEEIEFSRDGRWVLSAHAAGERSCPACGELSTSRHDWHHRRLQDFPVQGTPLLLDLRLGRWRCLNEQCSRKTFVERVPSVAAPMARRTVRVAEIVRLFAHAAGGLPSERSLARLRHAGERQRDPAPAETPCS